MMKPTINCLCGAVSGPVSATLPAETELCHCNPCRHTTGTLFAGFAELAKPPTKDTLAECSVYHSSKTHDRLFCATCGTKVFVTAHTYPDGRKRDEWFAHGGAVEWPEDGEQNQNTLRALTNEWLQDARDGGLGPYMTKLGSRSVPAYFESSRDQELSKDDIAELLLAAKNRSPPDPSDTLKVECRCGGVSLLLKTADHGMSSHLEDLPDNASWGSG